MSQQPKTLNVKPADGKRVRDPITARHLPNKYTEVPDNSYWRRRLRDGDVVLPAKERAKLEESK